MIYEFKKIDLWSAIKVCFLLSLVIGLIIGIFSSIIFTIIFSLPGQLCDYDSFSGSGFNPAAFGIFGGILIGVLYGFIFVVINGIITPLITVFLYNLIAGWVGGFKVHLIDTGSVQISKEQKHQIDESTGGNTSNV